MVSEVGAGEWRLGLPDLKRIKDICEVVFLNLSVARMMDGQWKTAAVSHLNVLGGALRSKIEANWNR